MLNGSLLLINSSIALPPCILTQCLENLLIAAGGNITLVNSSIYAPSVELFAFSLVVDAMSLITTDGGGPATTDPALEADGTAGRGGGHAGAGADSMACSGSSKTTGGGMAFGFGNLTTPFDFGGASAAYSPVPLLCNTHARGGGRIWIATLGDVLIDGMLSADGEEGTGGQGCTVGSGGGAGGSVYVGSGNNVVVGETGYISTVGGNSPLQPATGGGGGGFVSFESASLLGATQASVNTSGGVSINAAATMCPIAGAGVWFHSSALSLAPVHVDTRGMASALAANLVSSSGGSGALQLPPSVAVAADGTQLSGSAAALLYASERIAGAAEAASLHRTRGTRAFLHRWSALQQQQRIIRDADTGTGAKTVTGTDAELGAEQLLHGEEERMAEAARTLSACLTKSAPRRLRQAAAQAAQYAQQIAPWQERSRAMRAAKGMARRGTSAPDEAAAVDASGSANAGKPASDPSSGRNLGASEVAVAPSAAASQAAAFEALVDLLEEHAVSWCVLAHPHVFPDSPPEGSLEEAQTLARVMHDAQIARQRSQHIASGPRALLQEAADRTAAGTWQLRLSPRTAARRHVLPLVLQRVLDGVPPLEDEAAVDTPAQSILQQAAAPASRQAQLPVAAAVPISQTSTQTFLVCSSQSVAPGVFSPLTISAVTAWPTISNVGTLRALIDFHVPCGWATAASALSHPCFTRCQL